MNFYGRQRLCLCLRTFKPQRMYSADAKISDSLQSRLKIFEEERTRQLNMIKYTEKITVKHVGPPETCDLVMNKYYSTPYNCAQHIQELLTKRSVLALVNGKPWSMHRPLEDDCELQFLHFKQDDPKLANECFWRSCAFVLRYVLETAFNSSHLVRTIISGKCASVSSGSFAVDAKFSASLRNWSANERELRALSVIAQRLHHDAHRLEPLSVRIDMARRMFADCPSRIGYLDSRIANQSAGSVAGVDAVEEKESRSSLSSDSDKVTVYRMGDYVDLDDGVLMNNTAQLGLFSVSALHRLSSTLKSSETDGISIRRVQGIALPTAFLTHHATFEWLARRAAQFNHDLPLPTGASLPESESKAKLKSAVAAKSV